MKRTKEKSPFFFNYLYREKKKMMVKGRFVVVCFWLLAGIGLFLLAGGADAAHEEMIADTKKAAMEYLDDLDAVDEEEEKNRRMYGVDFFKAGSFEKYGEYSMFNYDKIIVFCGFFPHHSKWGAQNDPNRRVERGNELEVQMADERMRRETRAAREFVKLARAENDDVRFIATNAAAYSVAGGSDLTSLFTDEIKCHVFNRRTMADLTAPQESIKMTEFKADNEELWKVVRGFYEAKPSDPYNAYGPGEDEDADATDNPSKKARSKFLIDYSMINRTELEMEWPELKEPMCGGAAECEIPRVRNISNREFMLRYYLWGRPVIIEDAMDAWPMMGKWTEDFLVDNIKQLKKRRRQTGESQLLNVLDKDDQAFLRQDYDIPYFLDFGERGKASLDTELLFFGEKGANGLSKHIDTGCHQYWVPHIQGTKQWEMWPIESAEYAAGDGDRGHPRSKEWHLPKLTGTVTAGEILVFYSGWWHKTNYIVENEPTLSFTMYLHRPIPKLYVDEYRHALLTRPEYKMCMQKWFSPELIVGGKIEALAKQAERQEKLRKAKMRAEWKNVRGGFLGMDEDGDERVSASEWRDPASAFGDVDANGDGFIDMQERKAWFLDAFEVREAAEACAESGECPAEKEEEEEEENNDDDLESAKAAAAKAVEATDEVAEEECELEEEAPKDPLDVTISLKVMKEKVKHAKIMNPGMRASVYEMASTACMMARKKDELTMAQFLKAAKDWPMPPRQLKRQWRMIVQLFEAEIPEAEK